MVEYTGLTEYEAKVYLSLLGLGCSGARRLSVACNVPRTKIYGTLKRMITCGLVKEVPGMPKHFTPVSPEDAFSSTLKMTLHRAQDFSEILGSLAETHENVEKGASPQEKVLWHIDDEDDIITKSHEIIAQSQEVLEVLTDGDGLALLFRSSPNLLDRVKGRGVDVRIYSSLNPRTNPLARELSYVFEVRMVDLTTPLLFIDSDRRRFLLAKVANNDNQESLESAIFSDDVSILDLLSLLTGNFRDDDPFYLPPHWQEYE